MLFLEPIAVAADSARATPRRSNDGERRQVLFGVAALAGWLEEFANVPALEVLAVRLGRELPAAVKRARLPALESKTAMR